MDTSTPEADKRSNIPADQFASLRQQRAALEKIFKVAAAVERLHTGLRCALEMGEPPRRVSAKARDFLAKLDGDTLTQPNEKLNKSLMQLDREVSEHLGKMVELADIGADVLEDMAAAPDSDSVEPMQKAMRLLNEFSRKAQTSAAIRVLLHERGVPVRPVTLGLPTRHFKKRIHDLKLRETACREQAKRSIQGIQRDLNSLLSNPSFPADIVELLQETRRGLEKNLRHLERGGNMDELPAPMELINVAEDAYSALPPDEREAPPPDEPGQSQSAQPSGESRPMGFFERLWWWLNSPYKVGWDDVERYAHATKQAKNQPPSD